ncbi:hypothetical protein [uncultured Aquimarina sp.]|nr:hypothetical protein [uncultured Aquimarina sp.]
MITELITKGEDKRDNKIEITRLKEMNIVNNGLLKTSKKLAKAYNINI